MSVKLIKHSEGLVRKISDSYSVLNLLTVNECSTISLWESRAENHEEISKTSNDRVYYILEGGIIINDNISGEKGDVIFIPSNTEYSFKWTFKAILINSPAFRKENETISKL